MKIWKKRSSTISESKESLRKSSIQTSDGLNDSEKNFGSPSGKSYESAPSPVSSPETPLDSFSHKQRTSWSERDEGRLSIDSNVSMPELNTKRDPDETKLRKLSRKISFRNRSGSKTMREDPRITELNFRLKEMEGEKEVLRRDLEIQKKKLNQAIGMVKNSKFSTGGEFSKALLEKVQLSTLQSHHYKSYLKKAFALLEELCLEIDSGSSLENVQRKRKEIETRFQDLQKEFAEKNRTYSSFDEDKFREEKSRDDNKSRTNSIADEKLVKISPSKDEKVRSQEEKEKGKTFSSQEEKGRTYSSQEEKGKIYSSQEEKVNFSQEEKGRTYSNQEEKGRSYSNQDERGRTYSNQDEKGRTYSNLEEKIEDEGTSNQLNSSLSSPPSSPSPSSPSPSSPFSSPPSSFYVEKTRNNSTSSTGSNYSAIIRTMSNGMLIPVEKFLQDLDQKYVALITDFLDKQVQNQTHSDALRRSQESDLLKRNQELEERIKILEAQLNDRT